METRGPKDYSIRMLEHLNNQIKDLREAEKSVFSFFSTNNELKIFLMENIVAIINEARSDAEAEQRVRFFVMQLPVKHEDKILPFGDLYGVTTSLKIRPLYNEKVLSAADVEFMKNFMDDFTGFYKNVTHEWQFSYPKNENGEIMTQALAEWQADLIDIKAKEETVDFGRDISINSNNAKEVFYIFIPSLPEKPELENLFEEHNPCLIRTKDSLYFAFNPGQEIIEINLKNLKEFDDKFHPSDEIQVTTRGTLADALSDFPIDDIVAQEGKIIQSYLNQLFKSLDDSPENKELLVAWLKEKGGQHVNRFLDAALAENHFMHPDHKSSNSAYPDMSLLTPTILVQNWIVKDNKITFQYSLDVNAVTLTREDYANPAGKKFIEKIGLEKINELYQKKEKFNPLMQINAEVQLKIEKDMNNKAYVKPELVKFDVLCQTSVADSGKIVIHSPEKNKNLMNQLEGKKETPSHRFT